MQWAFFLLLGGCISGGIEEPDKEGTETSIVEKEQPEKVTGETISQEVIEESFRKAQAICEEKQYENHVFCNPSSVFPNIKSTKLATISEEEYDEIRDFVFSSDGSFGAFVARKNQVEFVVVNGVEGPYYSEVSTPIFDADNKRIAYVADDYIIVLGINPHLQVDDTDSVTSLVFRPHRDQLGYVITDNPPLIKDENIADPKDAGTEPVKVVVVDKKMGHSYESIQDFMFSKNGDWYTYIAHKDGNSRSVIDRDEREPYTMAKDIRFSPNSNVIAYIAEENMKEHVRMLRFSNKGWEGHGGGESYEQITNLIFSPNSEKMAHLAYNGVDWFAVLRDKISLGFSYKSRSGKKYVGTKNLVFSPNGSYIVYGATEGEKWFPVTLRRVENEVEILFEGEGNLHTQVVGRHYIPWDAGPEPVPGEESMTIEVSYDKNELSQNDLVREDVKVRYNGPGRIKFLLVDLGIPPGFSVQHEDLEKLVEDGMISRYDVHGRQVTIYVEGLASGDELSFSYHLRAEYPIKAKTPASQAYDYYNPDVRGTAEPVELVVV